MGLCWTTFIIHEYQYLMSSSKHLPVGYLSSLSADQCVDAITVHLLSELYMRVDLSYQQQCQEPKFLLVGNFKLTLFVPHIILWLYCVDHDELSVKLAVL